MAGGFCLAFFPLYGAWRLHDDGLRNEALKLLTKHWRNHLRRMKRREARGGTLTHHDFVHEGLFGWPGALVPFFLGEIDAAGLQMQVEKAAGGNATLKTR